jgi:hypothetical protein
MLRDFKIFLCVNSHADTLFRKQKRVGYFITMGVVVRRDDGLGMIVKGNDDGGWSSNVVVLWLVSRQNGDAVEW